MRCSFKWSFSRLRALFGDTEVRKCVIRSEVGIDGAQAMVAIWGRKHWNRCRIFDVVFLEVSNRSLIVGCIE